MTTTSNPFQGTALRDALIDIWARHKLGSPVASEILADAALMLYEHPAFELYAPARHSGIYVESEKAQFRVTIPMMLSDAFAFETVVHFSLDESAVELKCWTDFLEIQDKAGYGQFSGNIKSEGPTHRFLLTDCEDINAALNDTFKRQLQFSREALSEQMQDLFGAAPYATPSLWVDVAKSKVVPASFRDTVA